MQYTFFFSGVFRWEAKKQTTATSNKQIEHTDPLMVVECIYLLLRLLFAAAPHIV